MILLVRSSEGIFIAAPLTYRDKGDEKLRQSYRLPYVDTDFSDRYMLMTDFSDRPL
jgi:hypothetical protein